MHNAMSTKVTSSSIVTLYEPSQSPAHIESLVSACAETVKAHINTAAINARPLFQGRRVARGTRRAGVTDESFPQGNTYGPEAVFVK